MKNGTVSIKFSNPQTNHTMARIVIRSSNPHGSVICKTEERRRELYISGDSVILLALRADIFSTALTARMDQYIYTICVVRVLLKLNPMFSNFGF